MANAELPVIERKNEVQITSPTNIQGAYESAAKSNTLLTDIGSHVTQVASNQMAEEMGYNMGQHPHGNLGPPITEFDKHLQETYHAQAASTLTLQAQKMFTDSQVAMSKATRITPELISSTNAQLRKGIEQILANSPTAIRGRLETNFNNEIIKNTGQYAEKMYTQQREDTKNTQIASLNSLSQQVYELASSGNENGAMNALKSAEPIADNALINHYQTPDDIRKYKQNLQQQYINGKVIFAATNAYKNGKIAEFERSWVENPPKDLTQEQYFKAGQAFKTQVDFLQSLKTQDQQIQVQKMENQILKAPNLITQLDWDDFASKVSPLQAENTKFKLIQAILKQNKDNQAIQTLNAGWGDAVVQANADPKVKNATFNTKVKYLQSKNPGMTQDAAEVQVMTAAASTVPVFTQSIKNKLWSGNPAQMDSAAQQINSLKMLHAGHALMGLNDADNALFAQYEAVRNPADPTVGAKLIAENRENLDPAVLKVTDAKWQSHVDINTRQAKTDVDNWILNKFGLLKESSFFHPFTSSFDNPFMATHYSADILNKYKSFYQATRGNETIATKMTQEYVDNNYGNSYVNGSPSLTLHPIEKTIGFESGQGIPAIHADILRQLSDPLLKLKEAYDKKASNEYWTISMPTEKNGAIQITKHERAQIATNTQTYDLNLIGNNFDQWDIVINTAYGPKNLFLEAPALGVTTYTPDRTWIKDESMKKNHPPESKIINPEILTQNISIPASNNVLKNIGSAIGDFLIPPAFAEGKKVSTFIKDNEGGFRSHAYKDSKGIWTIGYGHTEGVKEGDVITRSEAKRLYKKDNSMAINAVTNAIKVDQNENQKKALADIAFNIGPNAFKHSTLVQKINQGAPREEIEKAIKAFNKETIKIKRNGKTIKVKRTSKGLTNRRSKDVKLYFKEPK